MIRPPRTNPPPRPVARRVGRLYSKPRPIRSRRCPVLASIAPTPDASQNPALAAQAEILARPMTEERRLANAVRALAIDGVEAAKSGHPGMPMGMADVATVLFTRFLKYDAADPRWADRDRFVLSAGHGGEGRAVLVFERHRRSRRRHGADRVVDIRGGRGGDGDGLALRRGEQEGRVSGEHGVELRPFPARSEAGEILLATSHPCRGSRRSEQGAQLAGAGLEPVAFQLSHQCGEIIESEFAPLQRAREIERELEHRVEQRRFPRALVQLAQPCLQLFDRVHAASRCSDANAAAAPNSPGCGWTISLTGMFAIRLSNRPLALKRAAKPEASSVSRMR